ncbi:MAG: pitrilysin family protein [Pseudomonadota bacterium]
MAIQRTIRSLVGAVLFLIALGGLAHADVKIQNVTSPSGQTIWLVEEPSIPIVGIELGFRGGSWLDPDGKEGLSRFAVGLMNEGSGDLDAVAFANRSDDISARIGLSVNRNAAEVSGRFLLDTLDEGIDLMALTLSSPRFDTEPIERVRNQILSGIAQSETDPDSIAGKTWYANTFAGHPYARPSEGTAESINSITLDDLKASHARLYQRAGLYVSIVGAIDAEKAGEIVDRLIANLPEGEVREVPAVETVPEPGVTVVEQDVPQSVAIFGHKGLMRDDPDFIPAFVMNYILGGGGFASRLTEEVREKRGLAYSVYSYLSTMDGAGLYIGGVQTANERIAESLDVIRAEWARMASEGMTEEDLQKAKTYLTGSFPLRFDSNSKIANYLLFMQMEDLGIDYLEKRNGLIEAVTLEDIKRVAARVLQPEALSFVVVGKPVGL